MPAATTPQPSSDPGSGPPELERIGDRDLGQWPTRAGQHLVAAIARVVVVLGRAWRWSQRGYFAWRALSTLRRQLTDLGVLAGRRP